MSMEKTDKQMNLEFVMVTLNLIVCVHLQIIFKYFYEMYVVFQYTPDGYKSQNPGNFNK